MKKSFVITAVRPILAIANPIVVFEVQGGAPIVRNPKQAVTDLQNSGLLLDVDYKVFADGIENVPQAIKAQFISALHECRGATIEGDITFTGAGEMYIPNDTHPIFTSKDYPGFGSIKKGGQLKAEKDTVWVDGFCTITLTSNVTMMNKVASEVAKGFMAMYGFGAVTAPQAVQALPVPQEESDDVHAEAFTKTSTAKTK